MATGTVALYRLSTSNHNRPPQDPVRCNSCIISSFYIKPQPASLLSSSHCSCIISSFYIKPQLGNGNGFYELRCIISSFYIKPQHQGNATRGNTSCIISSFYIKPQPLIVRPASSIVALYRLSTSNHNRQLFQFSSLGLHYIVFLHQTTTRGLCPHTD